MRSVINLGALAVAMLSAQAKAQTPSPSPSPTFAPSLTRTFVIDPESSDQTFMCDSGRVQSVLAFATAEHRIVSIVFVDKSGVPIPADVWSEAFGFRLLHRQTVRIEAAMTCGG